MTKNKAWKTITVSVLTLTIGIGSLVGGHFSEQQEAKNVNNKQFVGENITLVSSAKAKKVSGTYKTKAALNMRKGASTKYKKITTVKKGAKVKAKYKKKVGSTTWYKVTYKGKSGWMSGAYLKKYKKTSKVSNSNSAIRNKVISAGSQYLGVPYVWGGMSPSGFDCSGFTAYAYKKAGYGTLPHNSRSQRSVTKNVSSPEVGDLIFFTASPGGSTITHVGLYAGNNKVLHAAGDKVQYQSVAKGSYWEPRIVGYGSLD